MPMRKLFIVLLAVCSMAAMERSARNVPTMCEPENDWFVPAGEFVTTQAKDELKLQVEVNRLLVPTDASFGMTCVPSNMQEWAISVCEATKELVVMKPGTAEQPEVLWGRVRDALYKMVNHGDAIEMLERSKPKDYKAPPIYRQSVKLSHNSVATLRRLFDKAVGTTRHGAKSHNPGY